MESWDFPHGQRLTPIGSNNTSIEAFLDDVVSSLTREVIQNSLDAKEPSINKPVIVKFSSFKIKRDDIPGREELVTSLDLAKEMWGENNKNNQETMKYLDNFERVLNKEDISVLKISDYNTTGLDNNNYDSLVIGNSYSQKRNETAAGSKGIGKAAPFAASDLRMVFYSTQPINGDVKSAGVMNFVSYYKDKCKDDITQERAIYRAGNNEYLNKQFTFGCEKRNTEEYGTDLFIVGMKHLDNWKNKILLSTIDNFLLSIFQEKLEVEIAGIRLNKDNLDSVIGYLSEEGNLSRSDTSSLNKVKAYYEVIINKQTKSFKLDEKFEEYEFIEDLDDAVLLLLEHEEANRLVLQTRKAGMKIDDRNRVSGNINFTGIFQAKGDKLNTFLRKMENANHNKWSTDRVENKKEAEKFLRDLFQWYKAKVKECYGIETQGEVGAFGVRDLLPIKNTSKKGEKEDSGIQNKIKEVSVSTKKSKASIKDGDREEENLELIANLVEDGPGDSSGSGSNRTGNGGGDSPDNHFGGGDNPGDYGGVGKDVVKENERRVARANNVKLKVISLDYTKGEYRIIGISNKSLHKLDIELRYVGADGKAYSIKINDVHSPNVAATKYNNNIRLLSVKKNRSFTINFNVKSSLIMKMEASIYEIKS